MEVHLGIIGVLLIVLAIFHIFFPKFFNWNQELKSLSLINQQLMIIHTFFIALIVFLIGLLCLTSASDLVETNLGKVLALGLGIFWGTRLIFQLFVYSPRLWKGKKIETTIHILLTIFWTYLTSIFLWIAFN